VRLAAAPVPPARRLARWSIRTRVALLAAALGIIAMGAVGWLHASRSSDAFSRASETQALTLSEQLARAVPGAGDAVLRMIPYSERGLDGAVVFDRRGRVKGGSGRLARLLAPLRADARAVARTGRPIQHFRSPDGRPHASLSPLSSPRTVQITIVPGGDGAIGTVVHARWAADQLRSLAIGSLVSLAGGALFLCFALLLAAGRLVTRPVERLAREVRHLGEGNLETRLSPQRSPELEQLAGDIAQMRDDLLAAVRESETDPLTGIANHRAFHERLDAAVAAARAGGEPLAVIALDLDDLKLANDRHGHQAGDRLIGAVARAIGGAVREGDLCARVGGDEFSVICPGAGRAEALAVAARVEAAVAGLAAVPFTDGRGQPIAVAVSASIGVAELAPGSGSKDQLLHDADAAMYEAKTARKGAPGRASTLAPVATAAAAHDPAATARALVVALDARDPCTHSHCETVAELAGGLGERLGFAGAELAGLRRAALLHDVGKIGIADAILHKPARLTEDEFAQMRRHSDLGYRILRAGGLPLDEATWVLHHHEHVDGSGYPHGLRGEEIPLQARILLVADAFEAMTADRPYQASRTPAAALEELRRCAGRQFDPSVVEELAILLAGSPALAAGAGELTAA
jgi:diguanylate cyclase (GGDEF)-like protein/putative nucleotidyltransferase with HDIG domain